MNKTFPTKRGFMSREWSYIFGADAAQISSVTLTYPIAGVQSTSAKPWLQPHERTNDLEPRDDIGEDRDSELDKIISPISTILTDAARRHAAAKAFDYSLSNAYVFPMAPRHEIFILTVEVRVSAPNESRAARTSPHLFAWN